jgi:hypothetical protein
MEFNLAFKVLRLNLYTYFMVLSNKYLSVYLYNLIFFRYSLKYFEIVIAMLKVESRAYIGT